MDRIILTQASFFPLQNSISLIKLSGTTLGAYPGQGGSSAQAGSMVGTHNHP